MIVGQDVNKLLRKLLVGNVIQLTLGDSTISMQIIDENSKLVLTTQVYYGGNFIPASVRRCVQKGSYRGMPNFLHTTLVIDEKNFQIFLNYRGLTKDLNSDNFVDLLGDFSHEADEWRLYLDEHDKNDLVYVPVK